MGLVVNIENWPMPAAIALATEGVKANYNPGGGGGGFGAADREIGSKLDGAKILSVLEYIKTKAKHLCEWALFAYASPGWNGKRNKDNLIHTLMNDWVMTNLTKGTFIQKRTFDKFMVIVPVIAGGVALEQVSGATVERGNGGLDYIQPTKRENLISLLVDHDCQLKGDDSESFRKKRTRYYQNHWNRWQEHIETVRTILIKYDKAAQKMFRKELENKMGAIYSINS